jgi:hypothetical protein
MKKMAVVTLVVLALILAAAADYAQAAKKAAAKKVAGVHIVHPGEDLETKARALKLPYYMDATQNSEGDMFLVMPANAETMMEVFALEMNDDGSLRLGSRQSRIKVSNAGEGFVLRHLVPEGIPNLAMCFFGEDRHKVCWIPRYSGEDGSLVLDEGFYPVRESNEDKNGKKYSKAPGPLLTGPDLFDSAQVFVERLKGPKHLARMAAEHRFVPRGELQPDKPHHLLFVPLNLPTTIKLHIMRNKGGDGFIDPEPVWQILLNDDDAAVLSLDLNTPPDQASPDEENEYIIMAVDGATGETYYWSPRINPKTGYPEGYGLGPVEKFVEWPY